MKTNTYFFERPYSLLFLFGLLSSVLGVSIWPLAFAGIHFWEDPLSIHRTTMFGLFMFSFIEGFLLTALPNFTKTTGPSANFYRLIICFKILQLTGLLMDSYHLMLVYLILDLLLLVSFIFLQYKRKKSNPPPSFLFVVVGLFYGVIYFTLELFAPVYNQALLLEYGFILNIILGVGLKIIPVLLGRVDSGPMFVLEKKQVSFFDRLKKQEHFLFLGLVNLALLFQLTGFLLSGSFFMAAVLLALFQRKLKVFNLPKNRTLVTYGIWIALWSIITGILLSGMETFSIFGRHIFFISGISLLTIMIASRVTLSHGGHGLHLESTAKGLGAVVALVVLSAMLRFLPSVLDYLTYEHALFCAALLWVLSNIIWFITFGKKIYQPG